MDNLVYVFVPDLHLGIEGRDWRYALAEEVIREATRNRATLVFLGDTNEGTPYTLEEASKLRIAEHPGFRDALREHIQATHYQNEHKLAIHALPGNHDTTFNAHSWQEWYGVEVKCHPKLAYFEDIGVAAHHGHALEYRDPINPQNIVARLEQTLKNLDLSSTDEKVKAITNFLSTDRQLVMATDSWHRQNMITVWAFMEAVASIERKVRNLPSGSVDDWTTNLLETITKNGCINANDRFFGASHQLHTSYANAKDEREKIRLLEKIQKLKEKFWVKLLHRESLFAETLSRTLGARGVIAGHTHAPLLEEHFYIDPQENKNIKRVVVGNAGDIYSNAHTRNPDRYPPTYIGVDNKSNVHLFAWTKNSGWKVRKSLPLAKNTLFISIPNRE